jgi:hypothetical protein
MTRSKPVLIFIICLAGLQLMIHLALITRGVDFIISRVTLDDTYYYLQTAWNMQVYGFPTFDGINSTNGVQFLWFWLLVALAFIVPSKYALLFLSLMLCALLNLSGYFAIWKIYRKNGHPVMSLIAVCSWFYLMARFPYYLAAMENSLHALFFWLLLLQTMMAVEDVQGGKPIGKRFVAITLLAVLAVWTRLDSAIYIAALYLYLEWYLLHHVAYRKSALRLTASVSPMLLLSAVVLFLGYYYMGGSFIPVSGLVKSDQIVLNQDIVKWLIKSVIRGFRLTFPVECWRLFIRQPDGFFPPLAGEGVIGPFTIGALVLIVLTGYRLKGNSLLEQLLNNHQSHADLNCFRGLYVTFLLASALYIVYYSSGGINSTYAVWYLSPFFVFCLATEALVVEKLLDRLPAAYQNIFRFIAVGTMLIACLGLTFSSFYHLVGTSYDLGEQYTRIAVARWMRENTEPETVFAAWNAGSLCFLSDRQVINLDGLINNNEYYQSVLIAAKISPELYEQRLLNYLNEKQVTFVIDNQSFIPAGLKTIYTLERVFPIAGGTGAIEVYKNPFINSP